MKGGHEMSETPELSEARRILLEKYLSGNLTKTAKAVDTVTEHIEAEVAAARERVVMIQDGSKRPFFFLHGQWNSGAFFCFPLARDLGLDQPLYVLEPYSFDGLRIPPTFETIATAHLKSLRTIQPEGPYLLGGWCNGGLLAYEMARQLLANGQKIDLLILMDPVELVYPARLRLLHSIVGCLGKMMQVGHDKQLDWFLRLRHMYRFPKHVRRYLRSSHYRRSKELWRWGRQDYPSVYDWIAMSYAPYELYPGKITFFWSMKEPFRKGWRKVEEANEVEIYRLAGVHMTCFTEYLSDLAEHLRVCLSKIC